MVNNLNNGRSPTGQRKHLDSTPPGQWAELQQAYNEKRSAGSVPLYGNERKMSGLLHAPAIFIHRLVPPNFLDDSDLRRYDAASLDEQMPTL
jgi:hypothetical protein